MSAFIIAASIVLLLSLTVMASALDSIAKRLSEILEELRKKK